jgi:8-oxo-dGTP diphosphatase
MTDAASGNSLAGEPRTYPLVQVAAALLRRDDAIVLVRERRGDSVFWSVPGGGVEPGELITETLVREIKEETGITIRSVRRLAYIVNSTSDTFPSSVAFFFECDEWDGDIAPQDPEGDVLYAELASVDSALTLLSVPTAARPEIEPLVAYLRDPRAPTRIWEYRDNDLVGGSDPRR